MQTKHHNSHRQHIFQYLMLFLLMSVAFFSFTRCIGDPVKQLEIGITAGLTYMVWGIYHHYLEQDLNWKIVVEYIAVSLVGIAMLWMLLSYIS